MTRYALLCGSAPNDYRQKKLNDMFDSLSEKDGWHVTCMANGTDELMLECALNNILDGDTGDEAAGVLLYFCTQTPVGNSEETFWLNGFELRRDVVTYYENLAERCGVDMQVVWDSDLEMVSEDELGYEELTEEDRREFVAKVHAGAC